MTISSVSLLNSYSTNNLQRPQIQSASERFSKLDANGDGSIDASEFESIASEMSKKSGQSISAQDLLSKMDSDGSGLVSLDEFSAQKPPMMRPGGFDRSMMQGGGAGETSESDSADDDSSKIFDELDTNKDGVVDASELEALASKLSKARGENVTTDTLMSELDSDSDNQITLDEFSANRSKPPKMQGFMQMPGMMDQTGGQNGISFNRLSSLSEDSDSTSTYSINANTLNYYLKMALNAYSSSLSSSSAGLTENS